MQIEVLGERYQLQDPIGRGGMATIYRGRDTRMDRTVAIKVLREVYSTDPKFVTRFQREAKAASSLQHPNIVQVYDYGQSDGNYFIVMELIEGTDLRRYLRSRGVLAVDRAIIIAHDVALGLGAAHRRSIVHRDVKPQNVLVGRDGSIKLTDFGIASVYKDINAERLTTTGMTLGTVQYYAPEQAQGEIVSPSADVYALGIVMYEMLTGRTPFDGDTPVAVAMQHIQDIPAPPSQFNPNIPPALEEIILRCLEKVPGMRFSDGSSLARALEMLGEDEINSNLPNSNPGATVIQSTNGNNHNQSTQLAGDGAYPTQAPNNRPGMYPYGQGQAGPQENGSSPGQIQADQRVTPMPGAMLGYNQQQPPYNPNYPVPAGSDSTRPFQKNAISQPGAAPTQQGSRFASAVTILILFATLLLLAFSIYLAGELGFLPIPGLKAAPTATSVVQYVTVPNFTNMTLAQAQLLATQYKLKVVVDGNGPRDGIVAQQSPHQDSKVVPGSTILLGMKSAKPVLTVPDLNNSTLASAEGILATKNIHYTIADDGADFNLPPNTVSRTDPKAGTTLADGQTVKLYVVNYTNGKPTVVPQPSPTTAPPAPTPKPKPKPTPTPVPSPTAGASPTATPKTNTTPTASPTAGG
jgi:serine/threonine protein kinase